MSTWSLKYLVYEIRNTDKKVSFAVHVVQYTEQYRKIQEKKLDKAYASK
jgi:hypothetical protein